MRIVPDSRVIAGQCGGGLRTLSIDIDHAGDVRTRDAMGQPLDVIRAHTAGTDDRYFK
jgi:hypothetical protein